LNNKPQIIELRQRIPIGFSEAISLLEETDNEPKQAEVIWKARQVEILAKQISVSQSEAQELLEFVKYESDKAIRVYKKRKTTNVSKILEADRNEERTLFFFWEIISHRLGEQVPYGEWMNHTNFGNLPEVIQEVLLVWQWLTEFDRNDGFVEQSFTNSFLQVLESRLGMSSLILNGNRFGTLSVADNLPVVVKHLFCESKISFLFSIEYNSHSETQSILEKEIQENEEEIMNRSFEWLFANSAKIEKSFKVLKTLKD
jgi:hypothetical protein